MIRVAAIEKRTGNTIVEGYGATTVAATSQARLLLRVIVEKGRKWQEFELLSDEED